MKSPLKLFLIATVCTGGLNAATLSILDGITGPSGTVLAENFSTANQTETFGKGRNFVQTFTVADGSTIDKIAIGMTNFVASGGWTDTVTFSFREVTSAADASTLTFGSTFDTATFSVADVSLSVANGDDFTLVFDVANTAASSGDIFAWEFTGVPSDDNNWASMLQDRVTNNSIDPGRGYRGFDNIIPDERDNATYVVAIPEPSSVLLGSLGVLALLRRRR